MSPAAIVIRLTTAIASAGAALGLIALASSGMAMAQSLAVQLIR